MKTSSHSLPLLLLLIIFSLLISLSHSDIPPCNPHDQAVLLQIKSHFGGVGLSDWDPNTGDCCYWNYVGCFGGDDDDPNPNPRYGRVSAVTIPAGQGLSGDLPSAIGNLPYLVEIMFTGEPKLTGPIPQSLSKLQYLEIIYLSSNSLTGNVPDFLGQLKNLRQIDLSNNRFTGVIPPSFSLLKNLQSFDVSFNQLCGPIPTGLKGFNASSFEHNKCLCGPPLSPCK